MAKKIAEAIHSTNNRKELEAVITKNLQEARAIFVSRTADIRRGLQKLGTRRPPRHTAQEIFDCTEDAQRMRNTGLDLEALLESHKVLLQGGNRSRGRPKGPVTPAGNPDDCKPSDLETQRRLPSHLPRRKHLSSEEEDDKSLEAFAKVLSSTFQ